MEYLDFDLEVTAADGGAFTVRVLRSPAGEATGSMRLPFDELVLQNRLQALQIALLRSGTTRRRVETAESHTVAKFGQELWDALFSGDIRALYEASRSEARRLDAGMRIKLRFEDASLAALPWEFLFDAGRGDYVTLSASTPVVRYISLPQVMEPLAVRPPLRVLGMIASPSDLDALDVERERQRLEQALDKLVDSGLIELVWMTGSTGRDLQSILRRGPWHIFHFVGHGGFDENRGEGLIVLTDDAGASNRVSATTLGRLLGDHDPLRLAVLNACESARGDALDVFASTAATLVRHGTPAVVAMQYEITDDAAIEFSRSFYEAIADDIPVDAALAEARKGVAMAIPGTLEWGTPVLYMRAPDGVLFDIPAAARAAATAAAAALASAPPLVEAPVADVMPPPAAQAPALIGAPGVVEAPLVVAATAPVPPTVAGPVVPPAPAVRSTVVAAATLPAAAAAPSSATPVAVGSVPGWSAPGAAAGGPRSGSRSNTRVIVAGLAVMLFIGTIAIGAISELGSSPSFPITTDIPTDNAGPIVDPPTRAPNVIVHPAVSDDSRIVFANYGSGDADLYTVDPSGTAAVALTSGPGDDHFPAWSPDGTRIAFTRFEDDRGALWVTGADGSSPRQLTDGSALDWAAAWTPDGSRLVFTSNRFEGDIRLADVWIVGVDDSSEPELLIREPNVFDGTAVMGTSDRVAYASDRDGVARSLYVLQADRFTNDRLTFPGWTDREPVWSPDTVTLVFTRSSVENPADGDMWSVRTDDLSTRQLTTDEANEGHPTISPDGQSYAFQRIVDGSFHIMLAERGMVDDPGDVLFRDLTLGLHGNSVEPSWR